MDDADAIEPFGFFTLDAARAGWYLVWRQLMRVAIGAAAVGSAGALLTWLDLGGAAAITIVGAAAVALWALVLVPRLTIQWAEQWYGATLTGQVRIGWGVVWRSFVAFLVAAVVFTPPNFVALSLSTAFGDSPLGLLGSCLLVLFSVANFVVTLMAAGWAMSKVAVEQIVDGLSSFPPLVLSEQTNVVTVATAAPALARSALVEAGVAAGPVRAPDLPVRTSAPTVRRAAVAAAPRPIAVGATRQCPKCSLYETEHGSVIGWYCRICGWRERKPR